MKIHIRGSQDLGELIASAWRSRGLSQGNVAKELGVTWAWIARGNQRYLIGPILRWAVFLDVSLLGELSTDDKSDAQEVSRYSKRLLAQRPST